MAPSTRDRISVDLRGLRPQVMALAQARRMTPSDLVRQCLGEALAAAGQGAELQASEVSGLPFAGADATHRVRLSLRLRAAQVDAIQAAARRAGLPLGHYLFGLVSGIPAIASGHRQADHLAAMASSCAELSSLVRQMQQLTALLRRGDVEAARPYRAMLDTLSTEVRGHLRHAAGLLASLQPTRSPDSPPPTKQALRTGALS